MAKKRVRAGGSRASDRRRNKSLDRSWRELIAGLEAMGSVDILAGALDLERIHHLQRLAVDLAMERLRDAAGLLVIGSEPDAAKDLVDGVEALIAKASAVRPTSLSADEFFGYVGLKLGAPQMLAKSRREGAASVTKADGSVRTALREAKRRAEAKGATPDGQFVTAMLAATQGVDSPTAIGVATLSKLLARMGLPDSLTNVRSLHVRLKRMRDRGFQQTQGTRGPRRRPAQAAAGGSEFETLPSGLAQVFGTETGSHLLALLLK